MKLLPRGLELADDTETRRRILDHAALITRKVVVIRLVTGIGRKKGRMEEDSIVLRYDGLPEPGAIRLTSAAGCVTMAELFLSGARPQRASSGRRMPGWRMSCRPGSAPRLTNESRGSEAARAVYRQDSRPAV